jgi:amidase
MKTRAADGGSYLSRREVLQGGLGATVAALCHPAAMAQNPTNPASGLAFASALAAAKAIRDKKLSSFELTQAIFDRIDRFQPRLNAFVYLMREEALARAKQLDAELARGNSLGAFHGVPIHVKESFAVEGRPCTWGIPDLKTSSASANADVVEALLGAGAVLLGATNVPINLGDWQSYNPIYGTTNNPWDLKRTPGGSSGGSAAALAAGLGYLGMGSDIGGSLRVPAHFSGVFAHKPTLDLVSLTGHSPGGARNTHGFSTLLAVAGPMARDASDLLAALDVVGGPQAWDRKAWSWKLPASRAKTLKDFRIGYLFDDPFAAVTPELQPVFDALLKVLEKSGARLVRGWPTRYESSKLMETYEFMLQAFFASQMPEQALAAQREALKDDPSPGARATRSSYVEWWAQDQRRLEQRSLWQHYFQDIDVFLTPVAFAPAPLHDHSEPQAARKIGSRSYMDLLKWISPATLTGCPATAAPIGRTAGGLPVGVQIMGPFWEDATPITFAQVLSREMGGFAAPPGFL